MVTVLSHTGNLCLGTEGCQSPSPYCHSRSCPGKQEVSRNGKQSHCHHRGASKHIFTWDAEKEASDPSFSPSTSFQHTPAPSPAVRARRVGFSSLPCCPIPFQTPSGLQTCPCITLFTSNCYLITLDQEHSLGGNQAQ